MDKKTSKTQSKATETVAAVIVAAGRGERAGQPDKGPKQYHQIGGRAVLYRTIEAFANHPAIAQNDAYRSIQTIMTLFRGIRRKFRRHSHSV